MSLLVVLILAQSLNLNDKATYTKTAPDSPALGIFGAQKVAQETPFESLTFQYGINPEYVTQQAYDGGTVSQANSSAVMSSGTLDGGWSGIESKNVTRYTPGQGIRLRFTTVFAPCVAQQTQEVGLGNADNDFVGFGCYGATFGIIHRRGGVQTFVPKSAWNGAPITFNQTHGNVYSLAFQFLGYGVMRFVMERPNGEFVTVHTLQFPNARTTPTFSNPALRFQARVYNWGSTTSSTISIPSAGIVQEGLESHGGVHRGALNRRSVSTTPVPVFTLANVSTWDSGVANMVKLRVQDIHASGTGSSDLNCLLVDGAGIATPTWKTVAAFSPSLYDTASTTWDGGGAVRHAWVFEGNAGGTSEDLGVLEVQPGETLTVVCYTTSGNSTTGIGFNWMEEF
jgi:hypothetical protein